jgi:hypothetical protein
VTKTVVSGPARAAIHAAKEGAKQIATVAKTIARIGPCGGKSKSRTKENETGKLKMKMKMLIKKEDSVL